MNAKTDFTSPFLPSATRRAKANGKKFRHRDIAVRQLLRRLVAANGIEVTRAALQNELLEMDLACRRAQPDVRVVDVKTGGL